MCCKKFAENQQSKWNIILSHHLKNVRWGLILRCGFDLKKLCFKLPKYYDECFRCFAQYSVEQTLFQEIHNTEIWNSAELHLNGNNVCPDKAQYLEKHLQRSPFKKVEIIPTAQLKYPEKCNK